LTLVDAKEGKKFIVTQTTGEDITWQALRFGIEEGAELLVQKKIPGGPVIVSKNNLEIALGRDVAKAIVVVPKPEVAHGS
jgi:Fe2+ transport system protein FeoA